MKGRGHHSKKREKALGQNKLEKRVKVFLDVGGGGGGIFVGWPSQSNRNYNQIHTKREDLTPYSTKRKKERPIKKRKKQQLSVNWQGNNRV